MSSVHFAYTVYNPASYGQACGPVPSWRNLPVDQLRWPAPIHSPFSITYHALQMLQRRFTTKLYDIAERTAANLEDGDVFIGHLFPKDGAFGGEGMQADLETVGFRTLEKYGRGRTCIFQPFVYIPEIVEMQWLESAFMNQCDSFVAICGEYWERTWHASPLALNNRKFLRLNMSIDAENYPWVRKRFNPKGKRRFLYVGHTRPYKNTAQLEQMAERMPGFEGGCFSELKGWHQISKEFVMLTPQVMSQLAEHYDVFLSTSTADAQATTVIEQMSSGFPIACTPQTGYEGPTIIKLDPFDTEFNCHQLENIQSMDEEELMTLALTNRKLVETEYSWEYSMSRLEKFVAEMLAENNLGERGLECLR